MPSRTPLRNRIDKATLEKLYLREGLSLALIGKRYGVSSQSALRLLVEYGIPRRGAGPRKT